MTFGNAEYAPYIIAVSFSILAAFLFYLYRAKRLTSVFARSMLNVSISLRRLKICCIALAIPLFALAALAPQWGEVQREIENEGSDVLIALDVSRSMNAVDVGISRLERAKNAARRIAEYVSGGRIGLIVFAGEAFLLCPMTSDKGAFLMFLDSAGTDSVNLQGTDIGAVFNEAFRVFSKRRENSKLLVLITDGEDHEGSAAALDRFKELGVSVYCAGVGRDSGAFIPAGASGYVTGKDGNPIRSARNAPYLKKLALDTGGSYFDISDSFSGLRSVISVIDSQDKNYYGARLVKEPIERFAFFVIPLIFLLTLELLLPEAKRLHLPGKMSREKGEK